MCENIKKATAYKFALFMDEVDVEQYRDKIGEPVKDSKLSYILRHWVLGKIDRPDDGDPIYITYEIMKDSNSERHWAYLSAEYLGSDHSHILSSVHVNALFGSFSITFEADGEELSVKATILPMSQQSVLDILTKSVRNNVPATEFLSEELLSIIG